MDTPVSSPELHIPSLYAWRWRAQHHLLQFRHDDRGFDSWDATQVTTFFDNLSELYVDCDTPQVHAPRQQRSASLLLEACVSVEPFGPKTIGLVSTQDASVSINSLGEFFHALETPLFSYHTAYGWRHSSRLKQVNTRAWMENLREVMRATKEGELDKIIPTDVVPLHTPKPRAPKTTTPCGLSAAMELLGGTDESTAARSYLAGIRNTPLQELLDVVGLHQTIQATDFEDITPFSPAPVV